MEHVDQHQVRQELGRDVQGVDVRACQQPHPIATKANPVVIKPNQVGASGRLIACENRPSRYSQAVAYHDLRRSSGQRRGKG
jgi:hypothetical protein